MSFCVESCFRLGRSTAASLSGGRERIRFHLRHDQTVFMFLRVKTLITASQTYCESFTSMPLSSTIALAKSSLVRRNGTFSGNLSRCRSNLESNLRNRCVLSSHSFYPASNYWDVYRPKAQYVANHRHQPPKNACKFVRRSSHISEFRLF